MENRKLTPRRIHTAISSLREQMLFTNSFTSNNNQFLCSNDARNTCRLSVSQTNSPLTTEWKSRIVLALVLNLPIACSIYLQHRFIFILLVKLNYPLSLYFVPVRHTRSIFHVNWLTFQPRNLGLPFSREWRCERVGPRCVLLIICEYLLFRIFCVHILYFSAYKYTFCFFLFCFFSFVPH